MNILTFNSKWFGTDIDVSKVDISEFFGNKFKNLPKSYVNMLQKYSCKVNGCYLVDGDGCVGRLLEIGFNQGSIGEILERYKIYRIKHDIIPFSYQPSHYEWCFDFDNMKNGQPTVSLHSWPCGYCYCLNKNGEPVDIDTCEIDNEFGVVVNTYLTFDEYISKLIDFEE